MLHDSTEQLEHLPANQRIIAINNDKQLILLTLMYRRILQIRHGHFSLLIDNDLHLISVPLLKQLQILSQQFPCLIITLIIYKHHMVVGIVLLENGLNVHAIAV